MFRILLGLLVVPWHGIFGHSLGMSGSTSGKKSKSMSSGYDGLDEWTSTMTSTMTTTKKDDFEVSPSLSVVTLASPYVSSSTSSTSTSSSIYETDKENELNSLGSGLETESESQTESQSSSKVPIGIGLGVGIGLLFVGVAMVVKRRGNLRDERERSQTFPPEGFATDRTGSVLSHDGYLVPSRQTSITTDGVVDDSNINSIYSQYIIYDQALKIHNAYAEATLLEDPEYELGNNPARSVVHEGNVLYETAQSFEEASYDLASSVVEDENTYYLAVGNKNDGC
jgi:hypothetical protein